MRLVVGSLCALLSGLMLTLAVRSVAQRFGVVAAPRDDRWHKRPTVLLGGVAIFLAFAVSYLIFAPKDASAYPILAAGAILFAVGLVDDLIQIKPYVKLVMQVVAAAAVVSFGLRLPWTGSEAVNDFLTIFWLVGITNAVNLLDNMDGLAGGISLVACVFLVVTFLLNGQPAAAFLPALLGGAVLGFLAFNFNPASIFMGDCGSMFLGGILGGVALLSDYGRTRHLASVLLTPVLILMIPIFDTCVVTVTRKLSGRAVSHGGRDHTSHRLVALGVSERRAVLMLYLFAALSGILALVVRWVKVEEALLLVPMFALTVVFLGLYLGKVRIDEEDEQPKNVIINVLANFTYKRRIFEVLLDVILVVLAYYSAYVLRWDANLPENQLEIFLKTLPLMVAIQVSFFSLGGLYRGLWRYTGINDLIVMAKSVLLSATVSTAVVFGLHKIFSLHPTSGPSRGVFVLDGLLLLLFVCASRLSFRLLRTLIAGRPSFRPDAKPVLIYGAGDGGELLIREMINNFGHRYAPVGFLDDDARKVGKLIHGYRIFNSSELPRLIRTYGVDEVVVSSMKVSESRLDDLRSLGVGFKRLSIRIE